MFGRETTALLRLVLEEVCEHEDQYQNGPRAFVASKLLEAAAAGPQTVDDLKRAGYAALRAAYGSAYR